MGCHLCLSAPYTIHDKSVTNYVISYPQKQFAFGDFNSVLLNVAFMNRTFHNKLVPERISCSAMQYKTRILSADNVCTNCRYAQQNMQ